MCCKFEHFTCMHDYMSSFVFIYHVVYNNKIFLKSYMLVSRIDPCINFVFSERALLNRLMLELHKMDSDVLVGHNISGFDLDVLLHRSQVGILASSHKHFLVNYMTFSLKRN